MNFEQADALNEVIRAVGVRHRALAIAALAPFGIHPGHKLLLFELDAAGPSTQAQLAAATGFEPPTITLSIRQLDDAGLVIRRPSPTDRRATLVELSDKGRALLPELKAAWRRLAEQTVAGFDPSRSTSSLTSWPTWPPASTPATTRPPATCSTSHPQPYRATSPGPPANDDPRLPDKPH